MTMPRAVHRGYYTGHKRAGQVRRLHIIREDAVGRLGKPGDQTLCGTHVWDVQHSEAVILSPMPATPPEGLTWCPACVGKQAELSGFLAEFAARLAESCAG